MKSAVWVRADVIATVEHKAERDVIIMERLKAGQFNRMISRKKNIPHLRSAAIY
ncbi:hypothetical protein WSS15_11360 [Acetobacter pasteurianus]|uniref:hypothetical protein n=1 Tax=Acetobacter pasteurianus TaxID=438 RepID=UPI001627AF22|nr:hypothetical protein [Acetobacter pasteurianus]WKC16409.1 hypothetical protein FCN51_16125 [Acetobacter pasteurianus]GLH28486.1 hypothetical protein WSS15_11360 [Acetobacter pasteurianus]